MEGWESLVYASREGLESSSPEDDIPEDPIGDVVANSWEIRNGAEEPVSFCIDAANRASPFEELLREIA